MERKKNSANILRTFASQLVSRALLMTKLGYSYGGDRDIYKALGYLTNITFEDYYARYDRQDIAKAIIDRPVKATWQGPIELVEPELSEETPLEKEWRKLFYNFRLKNILSRLDKLTGIGQYGILLLGLDDVKTKDDFARKVNPDRKNKLIYLKPFSEAAAEIKQFDTDTYSPRYGLPLYYLVRIDNEELKNSFEVTIHYSRCIHVTDDSLESEVYGTPRLKAVYNRLMDLEKVIGGDAEMFWRGARPGYSGVVQPDYKMTPEMEEDLKDQIDEYENNLRRILINEGITLQALAQQIADPSNHVDILIQMISAQTGIPKRVLTGSERGELASTQDVNEWKDYVQARREDYAEPNILRPLVDKFIEYKILPQPSSSSYIIKWSDLYALNERAKVDIGRGRAEALRNYIYSPMANAIVPPDSFLEFFLGLSTEQITIIQKERENIMKKEELDEKIIEKIDETPAETPQYGSW